MKNKHKVKSILTDGFMLMLGTLLYAVGSNCFLVPFKLSAGGVNTISVVLLELFNVPLSVTYIIINSTLLVLGYRLLGGVSVLKTIVGILFSSISLQISTHLPQYNGDLIISALAGGILVGTGIGMVVRRQASTGGTDFVALMLHGIFPHISLASFIWIIDCSIISAAGIIFGDFTVVCYTLLSLIVQVKMTDLICTGGNYAKKLHIISEKNTEIANMIMNDFKRGVTALYGKGMYSDNEKMILLCVVSPKELPVVCKKIKSFDSGAFIIVSNAISVYGEGFIVYND